MSSHLRREKGREWSRAPICEEIMAENFPKLMGDINPQIQEVLQLCYRRITAKSILPRHIMIKLLIEEKRQRENLKSCWRKMTYYLQRNNNIER